MPHSRHDGSHVRAPTTQATHQHSNGRETMADGRKSSQLPWRVTGVLGVVVVLLCAGLVVLIVSRGHHPSPGLGGSEQAAVDAASREMVAVQSFRLAQFDADFQRAQSGLTGGLLKELTAKKASLQSSLQKSKLDTTATVTQAAFQQAKGPSALVLVTMNNYRVDAKGKQTLFGTGRFQVTETVVNGKWLASDLTSVGLI